MESSVIEPLKLSPAGSDTVLDKVPTKGGELLSSGIRTRSSNGVTFVNVPSASATTMSGPTLAELIKIL